MTIMGLDYLKHKETQRSNLANERETHRSNLANESERNRSNLANEAETKRSNLAREAETNRSNLAKEFETHRSNVENELLKDKELGIKLKDVTEKIRHNQRSEDLDSFKTTVSTLPNSVKQLLGVALAKEDPVLGEAWDNIENTKQSAVSGFQDQLYEGYSNIYSKVKSYVTDFLDNLRAQATGDKTTARFRTGAGRSW